MTLGPIKWGLIVGLGIALSGYVLVLPVLGRDSRAEDVASLDGDAGRGAYVLRMGGCVTCHTNGPGEADFLAGGPALQTPFGTFYGPNITPDPEHGIGGMSRQEFFDAMTAGLRPDGSHYLPAFPYPSYARMRTQDVVDLKAYLDTLEPVARPGRTHELHWPFSDRRLIGGWKLLGFSADPLEADPERDEVWNRGRYLVEGPGHCGECHTARNLLGLPTGTAYGGSEDGPFSSGAPGIAGADSTIGEWTEEDIVFYLETGLKPDGDVSGDKMADVIDHATSHLTLDDLESIAAYLIGLNRSPEMAAATARGVLPSPDLPASRSRVRPNRTERPGVHRDTGARGQPPHRRPSRIECVTRTAAPPRTGPTSSNRRGKEVVAAAIIPSLSLGPRPPTCRPARPCVTPSLSGRTLHVQTQDCADPRYRLCAHAHTPLGTGCRATDVRRRLAVHARRAATGPAEA